MLVHFNNLCCTHKSDISIPEYSVFEKILQTFSKKSDIKRNYLGKSEY